MSDLIRLHSRAYGRRLLAPKAEAHARPCRRLERPPRSEGAAAFETVGSVRAFALAQFVERGMRRSRQNFARRESRLGDMIGKLRAPDDPGAHPRPAKRLGHNGKAVAADKIVQAVWMIPDIEGRVEIVLAARLIAVPPRRQIGLCFQVRKIIEQRSFLCDAPIDDAHVVIGGQDEIILRGDHSRLSSCATGSSQWTMAPSCTP